MTSHTTGHLSRHPTGRPGCTSSEAEALLAIRVEFLRRALEVTGRASACAAACDGTNGASTCPERGKALCDMVLRIRNDPREATSPLLSGRGPSQTPLDGPALSLDAGAAIAAWRAVRPGTGQEAGRARGGWADPTSIAENCGGRWKRRLSGTYYTAPAAVRLMVRLALWAYLRERVDDSERRRLVDWVGGAEVGPPNMTVQRLLGQVRILDPACGSGAFLTGAFDELRRLLHDEGPDEGPGRYSFTRRLYGIDSDPVGVAASRYALWMRSSGSGGCPLDVPLNVYCGDALEHCGRYDIILANPPYVRHELIPAKVKSRLQAEFPWFPARSDLYVYFFALTERWLSEGGVAAVICPTAWMHVGYGAQMSSYLADRFDVLAVISSEVERWFPQASVDSSIVLLRKPAVAAGTPQPAGVGQPADAAQLADAAQPAVAVRPAVAAPPTAFVRLLEPLSSLRWGLLATALDPPGHPCNAESRGPVNRVWARCRDLSAGKWGFVFHPAPLREFAGDGRNLRRLGDLAVVRRGFTTGANEFFYVVDAAAIGGPPDAANCDGGPYKAVAPAGARMVRPSGRLVDSLVFELPEAALHPLIKSPREIGGYVIRPGDLRYMVVVLEPGEAYPLGEGNGPGGFIRWGEKCGFDKRPTCAARSPWWSLKLAIPPAIIWAMTIRERFFAAVNCGALVDARLYGIYPAGGTDPLLLAALLNSSVVALQAEQCCRTYGGGGGPLDTKVYEVRDFLIPDPATILPQDSARIVGAFREMMRRNVLPVREECLMEDRARLDEAVLRASGIRPARVAGLAKAAREALCESVAGRTCRARRTISMS